MRRARHFLLLSSVVTRNTPSDRFSNQFFANFVSCFTLFLLLSQKEDNLPSKKQTDMHTVGLGFKWIRFLVDYKDSFSQQSLGTSCYLVHLINLGRAVKEFLMWRAWRGRGGGGGIQRFRYICVKIKYYLQHTELKRVDLDSRLMGIAANAALPAELWHVSSE
jgi:hypothetical protein